MCGHVELGARGAFSSRTEDTVRVTTCEAGTRLDSPEWTKSGERRTHVKGTSPVLQRVAFAQGLLH